MSNETPITPDALRPACEQSGDNADTALPSGPKMNFAAAPDQSDFASINRAALAVLPALLRRLLPDGKVEGAEYVACNPTRADLEPGSFKINLESGVWADFATEDKGGDVVSLVAFLSDVSQAEAARQLTEMVQAPPASAVVAATNGSKSAYSKADKTPIIPVPEDASPVQFRHPKHGEPSQTWQYHDAEGRLVGYAARFDYTNANGDPAKDVLPITYCELSDGRRGWRAKGIPAPRPLYRLPEILSRTDATIIVTEGEKAADAAQLLFPSCVTTTPMHGAKSPHKTDWSHVRGRDVLISADLDKAGGAYAEKVAKLCHDAGASSVRELHFPAHLVIRGGVPGPRDGDPPKGWDLADALAEGWTPELVDKAGQDGAIRLTTIEALEDAIGTNGTIGKASFSGPLPFEPLDRSIVSLSRREPPPFPLEVLGDFWRRFVERGSEASSAPVDYVVAALLNAASVLIGNSRWVSPWSGWREPTILWIALVGDPSSGKTPAKNQVLPLLKKIEKGMAADFPKMKREWATKAQAAGVALQLWEDKVEKAVKKGDAPPPKPEAADIPKQPVKPRIVLSDATVEVVALLLSVHLRGLGLHRDELPGWLGTMNKYGGTGDRAFWMEAYNGGDYTVDRVRLKGEPLEIPYNTVSVIGSIQPDRLSEVLLQDIDDGMSARFLWCWPKSVPPSRPKSGMPEFAADEALTKLSTLKMIEPRKPTDPAKPLTLSLSDEAADVFENWRRDHAKSEGERAGLAASHFGKMPGMLLRLALVLEHLWWSGDGGDAEPPKQISKAAVQAAMAMIEAYWKPMAERTFGDAALPDNERKAATLARWLLKERPEIVNARDLRRKVRLPGLRKAGDVAAALEVLVEAGWVRPLAARGTDKTNQGRQRKDYEVNMEIYELEAAA